MLRKTITNFVTHFVKNASGTKTTKCLLRTRGKSPILGPRDMSMFSKKQILMDAVSWSLFWERCHEFDPFTRWQADFIRYMFGWLTQDEEYDFDKTCKAVSPDMSGKSKTQSKYFHTSKALSTFLRHSKSFNSGLSV